MNPDKNAILQAIEEELPWLRELREGAAPQLGPLASPSPPTPAADPMAARDTILGLAQSQVAPTHPPQGAPTLPGAVLGGPVPQPQPAIQGRGFPIFGDLLKAQLDKGPNRGWSLATDIPPRPAIEGRGFPTQSTTQQRPAAPAPEPQLAAEAAPITPEDRARFNATVLGHKDRPPPLDIPVSPLLPDPLPPVVDAPATQADPRSHASLVDQSVQARHAARVAEDAEWEREFPGQGQAVRNWIKGLPGPRIGEQPDDGQAVPAAPAGLPQAAEQEKPAFGYDFKAGVFRDPIGEMPLGPQKPPAVYGVDYGYDPQADSVWIKPTGDKKRDEKLRLAAAHVGIHGLSPWERTLAKDAGIDTSNIPDAKAGKPEVLIGGPEAQAWIARGDAVLGAGPGGMGSEFNDFPGEGQSTREQSEERELEKRDRDRERRRAVMLRGIGEHLGNMNFTSGAEIRTRAPDDFRPMINEDAREEIARIDDETAGERLTGALRSMGIQVPDGLTASDVAMLRPIITGQQSAAAASAAATAKAATAAAKERSANLYKVAESFRTASKDIVDGMSAATSIKDLSTSNVLGQQTAIIKMVKAAGDTGRLSDQDVQRFARASLGVAGTIEGIGEWFKGEKTEAWKTAAVQLARMLQGKLRKQYHEAAQEHILRAQSIFPDLTINDLNTVLLPGKKKHWGEDYVTVEMANGTAAIDVPRSKAQQAIQAGEAIRIIE